MTTAIEPALARALYEARDLHDDHIDDQNSEYTRGQAELIINAFGMSQHEMKDEVIAFISRRTNHLAIPVVVTSADLPGLILSTKKRD